MPPRKIFKIRPSEIESEPYFEQLCKKKLKMEHKNKFHLEFSPLIINAYTYIAQW